MDIFSLKNWVDLKEKQFKHSIFDCSGCLRNESWKDTLAMFPVRGFLQQTKAEWMGLVERNVLQDKTKVILNELNQNYRKNYRKTFIKQVKQVLEMPKPRGIPKSIKREIENQCAETCVERYFKLQNEFLWWISYRLLFSHTKSIYSPNFFCWKSPKLWGVGYWNSTKLPGKNINRNSTFILLPRYCYAAV